MWYVILTCLLVDVCVRAVKEWSLAKNMTLGLCYMLPFHGHLNTPLITSSASPKLLLKKVVYTSYIVT